MFVHHNTGFWDRPTFGAAIRTDPYIKEYDSLDSMDAWLRGTFQWMLDNGLDCTSCGSDVFQIRRQS